MSQFVLDCSVAVSWCFDDEKHDDTDALLTTIRDHGAWVPSLWHLEVINVLVQGCKRGRLSGDHADTFLNLLGQLNIYTDTDTHNHCFTDIYNLSKTHGITSYDSAYLELAQRRNIPIATKDKELNKVAQAINIKTLL